MLSENREFYDLCRKYKYYYNAYKKIEPLKDVYWSKYLKEAYDEVEQNLKDIEDEMVFLIFEELMGGYIEADVEAEYMRRYDLNHKVPVKFKIKINGTDEKFANKLLDYIEDKKYGYVKGYKINEY